MTSATGGLPAARARSSARWQLLSVALIAALPTLAWGLFGGGFLTDDWSVWLVFDQLGVGGGLRRLAFEQPARPLAAPYYGLLYLVIGDVPVLQALILAMINAGVVVAAWAAGRRLLPPSVLWPGLVVLALAPNHAATRFWFVVGTYPLALICIFVGLVLLDRRRPISAAAVFVAATVLYEGVVALGVALVAVWTIPHLRDRSPSAAIVVLPTAAVAGISFALSPKRGGGGPGPLDNAESFLPGQVGVGLWGSPGIAYAAGLVVLIGLSAALVSFLPSFRGLLPHASLVLVGAALMVAAATPFLASGSIFGTTGVFDRNNLVPSVGVALVLGALWAAVHATSRPLAWIVGAAVASVFIVQQVDDLLNWRRAVRHGDSLVADIAAADLDSSRPLLVVPSQPGEGTGVADFIYDGDLQGALRYELGGDWSDVRLIENFQCSALDLRNGDVVVFDWVQADVRLVPATEVARMCVARRAT